MPLLQIIKKNGKFYVGLLLALMIPIEYRYDKPLRTFSLRLIPEGLVIPPNYSKKIFFYPSDLLALLLLAWALFRFSTHGKKFFAHPLWALFVCAIGSIISSPLSQYPIPYIRLLQWLTPIVFFSFLTSAFKEEEREKGTRWILIAFLISALFQAGVGISQYFIQGPVGFRLLGETDQFAFYKSLDNSRWIFDAFRDGPSTLSYLIRAKGTMPHSNPYGALLFVSLLFSYLLFLKKPSKKLLFAVAIPIQFFALALSFSRAAFFAWMIATLIWFTLLIRQRGHQDPSLRFLGLMIAASLFMTGGLIGKQVAFRGGIVNYTQATQRADADRIILQKTALKIIQDKPLWGLGYSQFSNRSKPYFPENASENVKLTAPHNIFLFLACETGLLSLGTLFLSLLLLSWRLIKTPLSVETATFGSLLIGFLFIGMCDFYPLFSQQGKLMFFLILALVASHSKIWYKRASPT